MKNSFRNLSYPELKAKRDELKKKYMEFRFKLVIGHVDNPLQKRIIRRQIARLNTLIREHEIDALRKELSKAEVK
ncbi:MAG: 50S ribosomal protein L29 [Treponema sp.]|nr:50S ribosomal protein L29 [Treponema sp.]MCL2250488.1 50S ribosomal protein L29 [Treponema sp.]